MKKINGTIKDIVMQLKKLDATKLYICEIKEPRSSNQNKLLWKIIHKIAKETYQDDMDVYCSVLERADAKSEYIITETDIENELRRTFRGVKFIRKQISNKREYYIFKVYYGSSQMDTKEMNELLDIAFQICAELEIPTMEEFYE